MHVCEKLMCLWGWYGFNSDAPLFLETRTRIASNWLFMNYNSIWKLIKQMLSRWLKSAINVEVDHCSAGTTDICWEAKLAILLFCGV
jgi:hypothetical protein